MRPVRIAAVGLVVAVAAGAGWWAASSGAIAANADGTGSGDATDDGASGALETATVERRTLTVSESLDGTLGYADDYKVPGGLNGTLTWIAPAGAVVTTGEPLYEVDGSHDASLMYGRRPAWRTLQSGIDDGTDIRQLEENLLLLGYTRKGDEIDRHWDSDTTAAVKRWQRDHGQTADGVVELGEVVFLPEPIRVTEAGAALGDRVGGGGVLSATSNRRVVSVDLAADERDLLEVGSAVSIELPDGTMVDGTVASIGRVAESQADGQGGTSTTLPVTITLSDADAAGDLDAAPVDVSVVTDSREQVLTVPVGALLALIEGGYAVEVVDAEASGTAASPSASPSTPGTSTHLVRVEPGLFDDGFVEITADGLEPGDSVVVPS
ncbi:MAG TPA: peptidoglycan-binding domain-containing protein [Candidatus Limnocylindrales bacterium]|nr:peptidoglycan-binding domain-containing protein [Candidatus Limnocylindrales bacterium]